MPNKSQGQPARRRRPYMALQYETDLSRRSEVRSQRQTLLVVTNGERTERDYFEALRSEPWVSFALRIKFERGTPEDAVARAVQIRQGDEYDKIWVVCDVDEYEVSTAIQHAKDGIVDLALSVPSFEVWLILHISEKCPRFNDAEQAGDYLQGLLPNWDKRNLRFSDFKDGIVDAVERAKKRGEPPIDNPSTAVWCLVELLRLRRLYLCGRPSMRPPIHHGLTWRIHSSFRLRCPCLRRRAATVLRSAASRRRIDTTWRGR